MSTPPDEKFHARYSVVERRLWNDVGGLSPMPPCGVGLWLYLLTTPHLGVMPGLIIGGEAMLAEHLRWPLESFRAAFAELNAKGMAYADWFARVIVLPKVARRYVPESPNVILGWRRQWIEVPSCELKERYHRLMLIQSKAWGEPSAKAFAKAIPNQNQIQKQIQNQKEERAPEYHDPSEPSGSALFFSDPDGPLPEATSHESASAKRRAAPRKDGRNPAQPALIAIDDEHERPARETPADVVFARYLEGWRAHVGGGRPPILTDKRRNLVKQRLKEGLLLDDLLEAVVGVWRSRWHIAERHYDIDLILRDVKHVEQFRDMKAGNGGVSTLQQPSSHWEKAGEYTG